MITLSDVIDDDPYFTYFPDAKVLRVDSIIETSAYDTYLVKFKQPYHSGTVQVERTGANTLTFSLGSNDFVVSVFVR